MLVFKTLSALGLASICGNSIMSQLPDLSLTPKDGKAATRILDHGVGFVIQSLEIG